MKKYVVCLGAAFALALCASLRRADAQPVISVGGGSYFASTPVGNEVPVNAFGVPAFPNVSTAFTQVAQANKWWSSLIWQRYPDNAFGFAMYPHPLAVRAFADGLDVGYVRNPGLYPGGYGFDLNPSTTGLRLGVVGMSSPNVSVDSYTDWTVTAAWAGQGKTLKATFGHGLPYVYARISGGNARVAFNQSAGAVSVWANRGNVLGVTIGASAYGIFAPAGSTWSIASGVATSSLNGRSYFSVAALPEATSTALDLFAAHAFAFVSDSRVTWSYNPGASTVDATFSLTTTQMEGAATTPLMAMYRHQWLNSAQATTGYSYVSPRGQMKLVNDRAFTVSFPYRGILPAMPDAGAMSHAALSAMVDSSISGGLGGGNDTYSAGKTYGRLAQLIDLADQSGNIAARDRMLRYLKQELEEWFSVGAVGGGRSAYSAIEAESFDTGSPVPSVQTASGRTFVTGLTGGSQLGFRGVDFGSSRPTRLLLTFASNTTGSGLVEIHLDSPTGPVIAGGGIGSSGGVTTWVEGAFGYGGTATDTLQGVHDIYLTVTTPYAGELIRLDALRFDRAGAPPNRYFAYDTAWCTLMGYPGSFGSTTEMNDHHFHYGYFVMAAATVARFDPVWASQARFGQFVKLLIADVANTDRASGQFPFLRNFDAYAGYSQASGHAAAAAGNNQESSSEAINFAAGVALWGAATGDDPTRDLGMFLYASEAAAIQQYWFNADQAVFPAGSDKPLAGIVWNNGAVYATFFSGDPDLVQGINILPVTAASLHLGLRRDIMLANYQHLVLETGVGPNDWQDINWSGLALGDPAWALSLLNAHPNYASEAGDSLARTNNWIRTLAALGSVDPAVRADTPHYAVFVKSGVRSHAAWNPTHSPVSVTFSDGFTLCVGPGAAAFAGPGSVPQICELCPADFNQDGGVDGADVEAFFAAWENGRASADVNGDGGVDGTDVEYFFVRWQAGGC